MHIMSKTNGMPGGGDEDCTEIKHYERKTAGMMNVVTFKDFGSVKRRWLQTKNKRQEDTLYLQVSAKIAKTVLT